MFVDFEGINDIEEEQGEIVVCVLMIVFFGVGDYFKCDIFDWFCCIVVGVLVMFVFNL